MRKNSLGIKAFLLLQLLIMPVMGQINWPAGQLLPSFPAPAQTQDLIFLKGSVSNERSWRWEAEGSRIGHGTGRLEGDGWLCQVGIDEANKHMVYGPYDNTVTARTNNAEFRMKIEPSSISIYNSQGVEVMSRHRVEAQGQVQLNHLSSGIYLIKIETGSKVVTQTLIKN